MLTTKKKKIGQEFFSEPMLCRVRNTLVHPCHSLAGSVAQQLCSQLFRRGELYRVLKSGPLPALAGQAPAVGLPISLQKCRLVDSKVYQYWPFAVGWTDRDHPEGDKLHPCSSLSLRNRLTLPIPQRDLEFPPAATSAGAVHGLGMSGVLPYMMLSTLPR